MDPITASSLTDAAVTSGSGTNVRKIPSLGRLNALMSSSRPATPSETSRSRASSVSSQLAANPADGYTTLGPLALPAVMSTEGLRNASGGDASPQRARSSSTTTTNRWGKASTSLLASDPRYRRYSAHIEKTLASFDSVSEWADFTAFLTKLLKTIQSSQPLSYSEIPHKGVVAKRLAQGLNPALPNGVHQRSLEVYEEVFRLIGVEGLRRDLHVWSSGLFPFFQYAATSVRPTVLGIYETYYLPLGREALRPITKGLTLSLLPALEEETGDFFERVIKIMDRLSEVVDPDFLFQCLFLICITNPSARGASMNYLTRRLPAALKEHRLPLPSSWPKEVGREVQVHEQEKNPTLTEVLGPDGGLFIRGMAAALEDDNVLVRRGVFDLLISSMPLAEFVAHPDFTNEDRELLMRSAVSVVLRKDLSLARRLYAWLLGNTEEDTKKQQEYFHKHGLDLLTTTLKSDMQSVITSQSFASARPFKVFVSLLDKWEIGYPLSQTLAFDAFLLLQQAHEVARSSEDSSEIDNIEITARALYEAVEPYVLWSSLYRRIVSELRESTGVNGNGHSSRSSGQQLTTWILSVFRIHDTETVRIHLPLMLRGILLVVLEQQGKGVNLDACRGVLLLASQIASLLEVSGVEMGEEHADIPTEPVSLKDIQEFYQPERQGSEEEWTQWSSKVLQSTSTFWTANLNDVLDLLHQAVTARDHQSCLQMVRLVSGVIRLNSSSENQHQPLQWHFGKWREAMRYIVEQSHDLATMEAGVLALTDASASNSLKPAFSIDTDGLAEKLLQTLIKQLHQENSTSLDRIVELIWQLHKELSPYCLQSALAMGICSSDLTEYRKVVEALGSLWRLSDHQLRQHALHLPLMQLLGMVRSSDWQVSQPAERWFRQNIDAFFPLMGGIITSLSPVLAERLSEKVRIAGRDLEIWRFTTATDESLFGHSLESLHTLISITPDDIWSRMAYFRFSFGPEKAAEPTYQEAVVNISLKVLWTDAALPRAPRNDAALDIRQSSAIKLLHLLVAHTDPNILIRADMEASVTRFIFLLIHRGKVEMQQQMLPLLQTVLDIQSSKSGFGHSPALLNAAATPGHRRGSSTRSRSSISEKNSPLLLQAILDAITLQSNRPILSLWTDLIITVIPQFQQSLKPLLFPIIDTLCEEIRKTSNAIFDITRDCGSETALFALIRASERAVLACLDDGFPASGKAPKTPTDTVGLFGYVTGVLGGDTGSPTTGNQPPHTAAVHSLKTAVQAIFDAWLSSQFQSISDNLRLRIGSRTRITLERFYASEPSKTLEALVDSIIPRLLLNADDRNRALDFLDELVPNSFTAVQDICQLLNDGLGGDGQNVQQTVARDSHFIKLLHFLELYIDRLEGPVAVQVLPTFMGMVREAQPNCTTEKRRPVATALFRCLVALAQAVARSNGLSDKRTRRDVQDNMFKLLDTVVLVASSGRSDRPPNYAGVQERSSSSSSNRSNTDLARGTPQEFRAYIASTLLPGLRMILGEEDKVIQACGTIWNMVCAPHFRQRFRYLPLNDATILEIALAVTRIPHSIKIWRGNVSEYFNDSLSLPIHTRKYFRKMLSTLVDQERDRFTDLLSKIGAGPSANIFANRELEMLQRAQNLRKLSLIMLSAEMNHYVVHLPAIQERLVDILRASNLSWMVLSEVRLISLRVVDDGTTD